MEEEIHTGRNNIATIRNYPGNTIGYLGEINLLFTCTFFNSIKGLFESGQFFHAKA